MDFTAIFEAVGPTQIIDYRVRKYESGKGKFSGLIWRVETYGDRDQKTVVEFDANGEVIEVKEIR